MEQKHQCNSVNGFWRRSFNGTVYMEFRVYFTTAKYENDVCLLCETSNAFIRAFCHSTVLFHQAGTFRSIKTMLKSFHVLFSLSPVWNRYIKGSHKALNNRV